MNTAILFINPDKWSVEKWHADKGGYRASDGLLVIEDGEEWISLIEQKDIFDDYESDEIAEVKNFLASPLGYLLEWKGESLLSMLLQEADPSSVIDNDHGLICQITDLEHKAIPEWQRAKSIDQV